MLISFFLESLGSKDIGEAWGEENTKCDALRDLAPFVQFKKHEKHPRRSVKFSKVAG